ncbi:Hypothetical predicted protein [Olea europaea subsp. europaea]|uniref:IBH1-like N-terminal domain-containing protein n=1 Tax=Olea europaea subsp. europaea TaxID=158383 RepID=A0A8S0Q9K5_OLEEU|nr:Hypothetical predicted protein [Olea europaea subsp. europaea]
MTTQTTPSNPNSIKTRFTYRFVQALRKLNKTRSVSVSPSMKETYRRYHMIRVASYASMASAVGSRRAWSRTVLWKIRNRTLHRTLKKKGKIHALRRRKVRENPRNSLNFHRENDLKKLVPGGEGFPTDLGLHGLSSDNGFEAIKWLALQQWIASVIALASKTAHISLQNRKYNFDFKKLSCHLWLELETFTLLLYTFEFVRSVLKDERKRCFIKFSYDTDSDALTSASTAGSKSAASLPT